MHTPLNLHIIPPLQRVVFGRVFCARSKRVWYFCSRYVLYWSRSCVCVFIGEKKHSGDAVERNERPVDDHQPVVGAPSGQFHFERIESAVDVRNRFDKRNQTRRLGRLWRRKNSTMDFYRSPVLFDNRHHDHRWVRYAQECYLNVCINADRRYLTRKIKVEVLCWAKKKKKKSVLLKYMLGKNVSEFVSAPPKKITF